MAYTDALLDIETVVTRFLLKYKKTTEDYVIYLEHACNCVRDFNLYHSNEITPLKMTVTANKFLEMPDDMIGFGDIAVPIEGRWWSMTEQKEIVNTTTFTGTPPVEGRDSTFEEGVDIKHALSDTYGAKGGVNEYNYTIDWRARRIFLDGIDSGTVVLFYNTSGVTVSGTTYVSDLISPVIDSYLLWKETIWIPALARQELVREKTYDKEVAKVRYFINSLNFDQFRDLILGGATQAVTR